MSFVPKWMKKKENRPIVLILSIILICAIVSIISLISSGLGITTLMCFFITIMQIVLLLPMALITVAKNLKKKDAELRRRGFDPAKKGEYYEPGAILSGIYWLKERKKLVIFILVSIFVVGLFSLIFINANLYLMILWAVIIIFSFFFLFFIFFLMFDVEKFQEKSMHPEERSLYRCSSCGIWINVKSNIRPMELECISCGAYHILPHPDEVKDMEKEYEFVLCPLCKSNLIIKKPLTGPVICRCGVEIFEP